MMHGTNLLVTIISSWLTCILIAWLFDYGPEIYHEQKTTWIQKHPKKLHDPEMTMELPRAKFDPEITIPIPKITNELPVVFVIGEHRPSVRHGRHARGH